MGSLEPGLQAQNAVERREEPPSSEVAAFVHRTHELYQASEQLLMEERGTRGESLTRCGAELTGRL